MLDQFKLAKTLVSITAGVLFPIISFAQSPTWWTLSDYTQARCMTGELYDAQRTPLNIFFDSHWSTNQGLYEVWLGNEKAADGRFRVVNNRLKLMPSDGRGAFSTVSEYFVNRHEDGRWGLQLANSDTGALVASVDPANRNKPCRTMLLRQVRESSGQGENDALQLEASADAFGWVVWQSEDLRRQLMEAMNENRASTDQEVLALVARLDGIQDHIAALSDDVEIADSALRNKIDAGDEAVRAEFEAADLDLSEDMLAGDEAVRAEFEAGDLGLSEDMLAGDEAVRAEFEAADLGLAEDMLGGDASVRAEFEVANLDLREDMLAGDASVRAEFEVANLDLREDMLAGDEAARGDFEAADLALSEQITNLERETLAAEALLYRDLATLRTDMNSADQSLQSVIDNSLEKIEYLYNDVEQLRSDTTVANQSIRLEMEANVTAIREDLLESDEAVREDLLRVIDSVMAEVEFLTVENEVNKRAIDSLSKDIGILHSEVDDKFAHLSADIRTELEDTLSDIEDRLDGTIHAIGSLTITDADLDNRLANLEESHLLSIDVIGTLETLRDQIGQLATAQTRLNRELDSLKPMPYDVLPVGSVIWWYAPADDHEIPDGWTIANGSAVRLRDGTLIETPDLLIENGKLSIEQLSGPGVLIQGALSGDVSGSLRPLPLIKL